MLYVIGVVMFRDTADIKASEVSVEIEFEISLGEYKLLSRDQVGDDRRAVDGDVQVDKLADIALNRWRWC